MRNQPLAISAVLSNAAADGLSYRRAVWIVAKRRDNGLPAELGIWNGDEDFNLTVLSGENGAPVTRPYRAGGNLLKISEFARTSDMSVQTLTIDVSQLATVAQQVVREYDLHRARVELHDIILDPETGFPVAPDLATFTGIVDGAPIKNPKVGGEGSTQIKCVSDVMRLLTRTNSEKSSYEAQRLRTAEGEMPDELFKYAGVVETWDIKWGAE
ncbi:hypothetical protein [Agrobacterium rosae]|uniref:Uncharacterized protein n=1 Tax=Agrobacterium rosae TaxID=1972867 RepID=A0AAW9FFW9_9HYPH|nr:hypothetical protein [Agrobacterium rosae]MDX8301494.1 hypothetical protein [Agrobacterium rosae]